MALIPEQDAETPGSAPANERPEPARRERCAGLWRRRTGLAGLDWNCRAALASSRKWMSGAASFLHLQAPRPSLVEPVNGIAMPWMGWVQLERGKPSSHSDVHVFTASRLCGLFLRKDRTRVNHNDQNFLSCHYSDRSRDHDDQAELRLLPAATGNLLQTTATNPTCVCCPLATSGFRGPRSRNLRSIRSNDPQSLHNIEALSRICRRFFPRTLGPDERPVTTHRPRRPDSCRNRSANLTKDGQIPVSLLARG
jgi:hypothetical protein